MHTKERDAALASRFPVQPSSPAADEAKHCRSGAGSALWFNPERSIFATLVTLPEASFTIDGASAVEDAARVHAGLKLDVSERIALFGFFEGEFSDLGEGYAGFGGGDVEFAGRGQKYAGRVGMKVRW